VSLARPSFSLFFTVLMYLFCISFMLSLHLMNKLLAFLARDSLWSFVTLKQKTTWFKCFRSKDQRLNNKCNFVKEYQEIFGDKIMVGNSFCSFVAKSVVESSPNRIHSIGTMSTEGFTTLKGLNDYYSKIYINQTSTYGKKLEPSKNSN
jgi:hypothetical protein